MAEFCLDCLNRMDGTDYDEADVVLDVDLCEGCGELRPCVVAFRGPLGSWVWALTHPHGFQGGRWKRP